MGTVPTSQGPHRDPSDSHVLMPEILLPEIHPQEISLNMLKTQLPGGSVVKHQPATAGEAGDVGSIPGSGRSPGEGHGTPLQYSCLENSMDRRVGIVHGVAESDTIEHTHAATKTHLRLFHNDKNTEDIQMTQHGRLNECGVCENTGSHLAAVRVTVLKGMRRQGKELTAR